MGRLLALIVLTAGTVALALVGNRFFGTSGVIVGGAVGLIVILGSRRF